MLSARDGIGCVKPIVIQGMHGLGDNLYQRAVAKQFTKPVHLYTPWPQLYADLEKVTCLRPNTKLRTQGKNERRPESKFMREPGKAWTCMRWHYSISPQETILESLAQQMNVSGPFDMRGPVFEGPAIKEPYIVVRPVCLRKEWTSDSRNPAPEYVAQAIEHLRERFTIVSVADLVDGHEWALAPLPHADVTFHHGELHIEQLLGLVRRAAGMVGGVGWIVPAALAYSVPLFLIYGGWGIANGPRRLFGPGVDHSFIDQVLPDAFCHCNSNRHACDKRIHNIDDRARAFAVRLVHETALAA